MLDNWNEFRTAAHVARHGTISATSSALGIHRATVTRHIDALEDALGAKLFQRHARGFTATELGLELLRIADVTDIQLSELCRLAQGKSDETSGRVVVTALDVLAPFILPLLDCLQSQHPDLVVDFVTSDDVLKLEYGDAALACRIGKNLEHPDNVAINIMTIEMGLFAAASYRERHGIPQSLDEYFKHSFVGPDNTAPRTPFFDWLKKAIPSQNIKLRCNSVASSYEAVKSGIGIGFIPVKIAQSAGCIQIGETDPSWHETVWAVTHVDLHRTPKVQAVLSALRTPL